MPNLKRKRGPVEQVMVDTAQELKRTCKRMQQDTKSTRAASYAKDCVHGANDAIAALDRFGATYAGASYAMRALIDAELTYVDSLYLDDGVER